ncbi:MAG: helix-hairpin-helix domain-containing protein [Geobacteraceae bacterium]|nr:helix-hairpin-helix domain-containing protein [Geobacteraceae bacterium]
MSHKFLRTILFLVFAVALCAPTQLLAALSVNVNTASTEQLEQINGVGPKTAEKIIEYRENHGEFTSVDQLSNIKGIGDKSLQKMAQNMTLE